MASEAETRWLWRLYLATIVLAYVVQLAGLGFAVWYFTNGQHIEAMLALCFMALTDISHGIAELRRQKP